MSTPSKLTPTLLLCASFIPSMTLPSFPDHPDLDLLKLTCSRVEEQNGQKYQSEIHFVKAGRSTLPNRKAPDINDPTNTLMNQNIEGEVLSYLVRNKEKVFISGYSLFAISYHDQLISGMTGDPMTAADGSFSLSRMKQRTKGPWLFSYTGIAGQHIEAEFECVYNDRFINN